jgi:Zn-dependent M28 family amino/carboxypeptidase
MNPHWHQGKCYFIAFALAMIVSFVASGCTSTDKSPPPKKESEPTNVQNVLNSIRPEAIRTHLRFLSHDLLEGRGTGQRGGEIAAQYIATYFELIGLAPGGDHGSYFQKVPLVGVETKPESTLAFARGSEALKLKYLDEYVMQTQTQKDAVQGDADMVFVGYGIVAPEYQWDDYKNTDVSGKILVMMVNDPPSEDPKFFGGRALTYYGRWTYKYEIAERKKAAGAILIHTPESAGYGWEVVRNSWGRETPQVALEDKNAQPLQVAGWITDEVAHKLFKMAGQDLDALRQAAAQRDFKPVPLETKAKYKLASNVRKIETANVIGMLKGRAPNLQNEVVIYSAHYDHLGVGKPVDGDAIYNGAVDNASGTATLMELAQAFARAPEKPRRSIMFMAVAAEEGGLRGSEYYASHPIIPPGKTAVDINMDSLSVLGKTQDFTLMGADRSPELEEISKKVATQLNFKIVPDQKPEQGSFYRSDQFNFAKVGIPCIYVVPGMEYVGHPKEWGLQQFKEYNEKRYHRPSDQFDPSWDLSGTAQAGQIAYLLGWSIAEADKLPTWKSGDEFAAARAASFKQGM